MSGLRIGVDIGGTFTDVCVVDRNGQQVASVKVRTTPDDPSRAVVAGVRAALDDGMLGSTHQQVDQVVHATTLITNAIVQGRGARVGLLVTAGFADTLEIARQHRYDMYDLKLERPAPLVARSMRREIDERILVDGSVERPLNRGQVERATAALVAAGAEAIAICFLHCYVNPDHEDQALIDATRVAQGRPISLSSRISGQIREYERMVTTVVNAYVQPVTAEYLDRLADGLADVAPGAGLSIMTSNGGVTSVAAAREAPVRLVESGPAAGALAAAADCQLLGLEGLLSFDMGGTTAKACLVIARDPGTVRPDITPEIEVARVYRFTKGSGLPLQVPSVELIEIGAGGGSIARRDVLGRVRVGPESAGAEPGPACYPSSNGAARDDLEPTVTDADVVLGYVGADAFLGGAMRLDVDRARRALEHRLGGEAMELAAHVNATVNEEMALAFRRHCVERGYDPAARPIYAFGGAGPVHACGVAELLGAKRIIVPPAAGIGSAVGLLAAPPRIDLVRTLYRRLDHPSDWGSVNNAFATMRSDATSLLRSAGVSDDRMTFELAADLRFLGQAHQMTVPIVSEQADSTSDGIARSAQLIATFEESYTRVYGRIPPGVGVQALQWRLTAFGPTPVAPKQSPGDMKNKRIDTIVATRDRLAYFAGEMRSTPVHRRRDLQVGTRLTGPLLIEEDASTTVISPGWDVEVLASLHLDITRTVQRRTT